MKQSERAKSEYSSADWVLSKFDVCHSMCFTATKIGHGNQHMTAEYQRWLLVEYAHPSAPSRADPNLDGAISIAVKRYFPQARRGDGTCFMPSERGFDYNLPQSERPEPPLSEARIEDLGNELSKQFPDHVITITQGIQGPLGEGGPWRQEPPKMSWQGGRILVTTRAPSETA